MLHLTFINLVRYHQQINNAGTHVANNDAEIGTTRPKRSHQVTHHALVRVLTDEVTTVYDKDLASLYENEADLERVGIERRVSCLDLHYTNGQIIWAIGFENHGW